MPKLADLRESLARLLVLPEHQVTGVLDRLSPVIIAGDLRSAAAGVSARPAWGGGQFTAAVNKTYMQLWNPLGSGVNLHVLAVLYRAGASTALELGIALNALTTLLSKGYFVDGTGDGFGGASSGEIRTQDVATFGGTDQYQGGVATGGQGEIGLAGHVVLAPQSGLHIALSVSTTQLNCGFRWIERPVTETT